MLNPFRNIIKPPITEDEEETRIGGLLQNLVIAIWVFPVLMVIIAIINPVNIATLVFPLSYLVTLLLILSVMLRRGFVHAGSMLLITNLVLLGAFVNYRAGGQFQPASVALLSVILMGGLLLGSRGAIITFIATIAHLGIFAWAGTAGLIKAEVSGSTPLIDFLVTAAGLLMGLIIFQLAASSLSSALSRSRGREKEVQALSDILDTRVQERTTELNRRSEQLEAAALVTRAATEVQDLKELLEIVVQQITQRFNFYHCGIFLTDINSQFVILEAASSEGGKKMIERGHRLEIGRQGIVGFAAFQKRSRIAQDVGEDAVFFNNPDLPETHSEVALPLIAHSQLIGILDIQSQERNAFSSEDIHTLQTMADQIAFAIENTRLIDESRSAIEELQMLTSENTWRLWKEQIGKKSKGYAYSSLGVLPISSARESSGTGNGEKGEHVVKFPIALRGQQIGVLSLKRKSSESSWTEAEQEMASKIAGQVALAIENARLLEESQRRAEKESAISDITSKIRRTNDPNEMIRVAINELKQALNIKDVRIIPYNPPKNGDGK